MNYIVDQGQLKEIRDYYRDAVLDPELGGVDVTFRSNGTTGANVDLSTGAVTPQTAPETVKAIFREITPEMGVGGQVGDFMFLITVESLTATPKMSDEIVANGVTYDVIESQRDTTKTIWHLRAKQKQ